MSCRDAPSAPAGDAGVSRDEHALDDASVIALSHALLDAIDRDDEERFRNLTSAGFTFYTYPASHDRDEVASWLRDDKAHHASPRSRTYGDESVRMSPSSATYVGASTKHSVADDAGPARDHDMISTIVWVHERTGLKAVLWQSIKGGVDAERERWNDTFRDGHDFSTEPSAFLGDVVRGRKPGAALDVAMGQGRNALFLASQGWRVTGVDISDEGLRIAREAASARKLSLDAINADADTWDFGKEKWDLIALIYAGCDDKRARAVRAALRPGGIVVVEGFHHDAAPAIGFATGALAVMFNDGFTILRDETVDAVSDWGMRDGSKTKLVRFAAERR
jgi:SAM-dependent methyltransferase